MSIRDDFFAAKAKGSLWDVAVSIKRGNPLPLDADSIFESYTALETYAAGVLAYPGQVVAVVNADSTGIYYLDQDLAIQPVGVIPSGDGKTIEVTADGVISILGSANADSLTLPRMKEDKSGIEWVPVAQIVQGDGNDNTTYEFTALEDKVGFSVVTKFNGTQVGDVVEYVLDAYTKSEADAITNALDERIDALEAKEDKDTTYSVAANDKVLKLTGTELSSTISLKHENGMISLTGIDGAIIAEFSDADFVKDGMLENVEYDADTNTLSFTWNTAAGSKTDSVVLSDIIEAYNAGNGLNLTGTEFSVKIDASGENFLTVGADGVKLSGVQNAINAAVEAAEGRASADAQSKADAAKQAAIDDAATKYATTGALTQLETNLDSRLDTLETYDHSTYATKAELEPVKTTANNASTAVANLETRFDEIVAVGGEPNAINKIQVNGSELAINNKTVNIEVPTKFSDLTDDSGFDARITAAKNQADKGVSDASTAQATADNNATEIGKHETRIGLLETAKGDHETRIISLENADNQHASEYNALKGIVDGHTSALATKAEQTAVDAVSAKAGANETAIATLKDTTIPAINTEINKKANSADVYTKTEIGTIAEGKTLIQMIEDAQSAATYDDTAIKASIKQNTDAIAILNGDVETAGSVAKVAADAAKAEVAAVVDSAPEAFNTLKEIATWISEDETATEALVSRVTANETAIAAINNETSGILASGKAYTDSQIAALPAATADALGLVKYDNATVKMNDSKQLYVAKVSTDILEQGTNVLILNGGSATE